MSTPMSVDESTSQALRFGGEDAAPCSYQDAEVVVLPVPYQGSVSYGEGTANGPKAILAASSQLEMYDEEVDACIDQLGIFTLPLLEHSEHGSLDAAPANEVMQAINQAALAVLNDKKLLVTLGGEHSISAAVFAACVEARHQEASIKPAFHILQIDAHCDLRHQYQGSIYSHACVMARAWEMELPFVQVGIRSLSMEENQFLHQNNLWQNVFLAQQIANDPSDAWMEQVVSQLGSPLYITVDVDGLDPSVMPSTGTPEPGGLSWYTLLKLLRKASETHQVMAMDIMELAPIEGVHAADFLAARLAWKMMGYAKTKQIAGSAKTKKK